MSIRLVNALAGIALIAGCASVGQDFDMTEVDRLQPGVTTLEQVKQRLGKPRRIDNTADGLVGVTWTRAQAVMGSISTKGVTILFDKDGKMVRVVTRQESSTN